MRLLCGTIGALDTRELTQDDADEVGLQVPSGITHAVIGFYLSPFFLETAKVSR